MLTINAQSEIRSTVQITGYCPVEPGFGIFPSWPHHLLKAIYQLYNWPLLQTRQQEHALQCYTMQYTWFPEIYCFQNIPNFHLCNFLICKGGPCGFYNITVSNKFAGVCGFHHCLKCNSNCLIVEGVLNINIFKTT